jgi:hypothetical protein
MRRMCCMYAFVPLGFDTGDMDVANPDVGYE